MVIFSQHEAFKEAEGAESSPGTGCQRFYSKKIQTHSAGPGQAGQKAGKDMARMEQDKGRGYMITLVWDGHLGLFEEAEEAELLWPEDEERVASAVDASGRPAHSVDVLLCAQRGASKQVFGLSVRRNITVWPVATRSLEFWYLGVIWGVILHDPVHLGDVQPSSCHISTQQDPRVSVTELEECGGTFGLLLLPLRHSRRRNTSNSWLRQPPHRLLR